MSDGFCQYQSLASAANKFSNGVNIQWQCTANTFPVHATSMDRGVTYRVAHHLPDHQDNQQKMTQYETFAEYINALHLWE
eukprot:10201298-Ditylum_brightwellii.AAC.1